MSLHASDGVSSPYELGSSPAPDAVRTLIDYLWKGSINEKRLAASAIRKLATKRGEECQAAVPALVACLDEPGPQVRQYALKALEVLRLTPDAVGRIREVQANDDRAYNRDLATTILRREASATSRDESRPVRQAKPGSREDVRHRIEACLDAIDILEEDLQDHLARLWDAENALADSRLRLEHAEQRLIVRGVDGKNEAERRARMAVTLTDEREAVENADRRLRSVPGTGGVPRHAELDPATPEGPGIARLLTEP